MPDPFFPFAHLGLQRNPFGRLSNDEWADLAILPAPVMDLLPILERGDTHLQLTGPKGSGKTTHLLALAEHFTRRGERIAYERLPQGTRAFSTPLPGLDRFLLDEAQRLSLLARGRLLRAARRGLRLVITSHADLTPHFKRHRLPLVTLDVKAATTRDHVAAVLARRLAYFALDDPPRITLTPDAITLLWRTFGGDLRAVENLLYEVFQRLKAPRPITPADLTALLPPTPGT